MASPGALWGRALLRGPWGFLLYVVLGSWPIMVLGPSVLGAWGASAAAMVAAGFAAWLHARLSGRRLVTWSAGRRGALVAAAVLPAAAYGPLLLRWGSPPPAAVAVQLVLNLAPGWAEEVAWRSYFYGSLLGGGEARRLLVHGAVWYLWHAPMVVRAAGPLGLLAAAPLGLLQASVYALLYRLGGVAAATLYHVLYDTLRDAALVSQPAAAAPLSALPVTVVSAAGLLSAILLARGRPGEGP